VPDVLYSLTGAAFVQSVVQAADVWNDHAHGGTLLYKGLQTSFPAWSDSSGTVGNPQGVGDPFLNHGFILPTTASQCDSLGLTESIVRVTDFPSSNLGEMHSRCSGTRFEIKIFAREGLLTNHNRRFFISEFAPQSTDVDLIYVLTHELGHALAGC